MKKLLIILGCVVLLLAGAAALAVYRANDLLAKFHPQLESLASRNLGAPVKLGALSLHLLPTTIEADGVQIGGAAGGAGAPKLGKILLSVDLWALLSNRLEVDELTVDGPSLTLVSTESGLVIEGLSFSKRERQAPVAAEAPPSADRPKERLEINLRGVRVRDGSLTYRDSATNRSITASNIDLSAAVTKTGENVTISSLDLETKLLDQFPFGITADSIVYTGADSNVAFPALQLSIPGGSLRVSGSATTSPLKGTATLSSDQLTLEQFMPLVVKLLPNPFLEALRGTIRPDFSITFAKKEDAFRCSAKGEVELKGVNAPAGVYAVENLTGRLNVDASPAEQKVSSEKVEFTLNGEPVSGGFEANVENGNLTLRKTSFQSFSGTAKVPLDLAFAEPRPFRSNIELSNLNVQRLLEIFKPDLAGFVHGTIVRFAGMATGNFLGSIADSMNVPGSIEVREAKLIGLNIPAIVLKKVEGLPFMEGSLSGRVPERFEPYLKSEDTAIKEFRSNFTFVKGVTDASSFEAIGDFFSITGSGSYAMSGEMDLKANIAFSVEFTEALVASVREVKRIISPDGKLILPLKIKGRLPSPIITPNLDEVLKLGAEKLVKEKAGKVLEKVLGDKLGDSPESEGVKKALEGILGF